MNNRKPEFTHRLNRVEVAVWRNENETSLWHTITFQKSYRDSEGNMQNTTSLRMEDLPTVAFLANRAYDFLCLLEE